MGYSGGWDSTNVDAIGNLLWAGQGGGGIQYHEAQGGADGSPGYYTDANGNIVTDQNAITAGRAESVKSRLQEYGLDPNAQYRVSDFHTPGEKDSLYHRQLQQLGADGNWSVADNPWNYSADRKSTANKFRDAATATAALLTVVGGSGLAAGALGGTAAATETGGLVGGTEATTAGIGGGGLTSTQAAALYGPEGYGAGMTGAETAAYDAGLAGSSLGDTLKQGYDAYGKVKRAYNLYQGLAGNQQSAPSVGGAGAVGGLSRGINSDLLKTPPLGAAQAQQQSFLKNSYGPVAAAEQRRKLRDEWGQALAT